MTESVKQFLTKYNYNESDIEIDFFQLGDLLDEFAKEIVSENEGLKVQSIALQDAVVEFQSEVEKLGDEKLKYRYCPYCGGKLVHEIYTDIDTKKVCQYSLCPNKESITIELNK